AERVNQFALPHGRIGHVVGWLMAVLNADMEKRAIQGLALRDTDRVLEIGFGPGVGIGRLLRRLTNGSVAGVDPSAVMVAQARRRNRRASRDGRVELREGIASSLPWPDQRFDGVLSVNNVQEWPSLRVDLAEVYRVLKPAGRLSIAVHAWVDKYAKDRGDPSRPWGDHLAAMLEETGFTKVTLSRGWAVSGPALF